MGAYLLHTVSFLELIYTTACVNKFLLTCKVGVTLVADFHFNGVCVLCCSRLKGSATSTYNSRFVIIRMYTLFHFASPHSYYKRIHVRCPNIIVPCAQ